MFAKAGAALSVTRQACGNFALDPESRRRTDCTLGVVMQIGNVWLRFRASSGIAVLITLYLVVYN